jgi:8-amino-7-oxononanoate synthase
VSGLPGNGAGGLDAALSEELARLSAQGLARSLPEVPPEGVDFTSNDYLGLSTHPEVIARARIALTEWGAGGRASRLLGGGSPVDTEAEHAAAEWLEADAALLFPSGYHANLGTIGALVGPGDLVLSDRLNHASLVDAARLSRARLRIFQHADAADAERILAAERGNGRALLVTESVFSMDGDRAPLAELADVCARHDAALVVDEAHASGVVGPGGAGGWADTYRARAPAARIVTGGKALGVSGAFVVGSRVLCDALVQRARTFAFTTAAPPAAAGGLAASIALCRGMEAERERCLGLARRIASALGLPRPAAAIVPVVVGGADEAMAAAAELRQQGFQVRAVRPPTVPAGSSRLRIACHSFNTDEEVDLLIGALRAATEHSREPLPRRSIGLARPLFVTGTDTGIGKTVVAALLSRAAWRAGRAAYWKPVQTGADDDSAEVARLSGIHSTGATYSFALPASPHEAARAEGAAIDVARLDAELDQRLELVGDGILIAELAGGLLVPLTDETTQVDWVARRRPRLVLAARSGLGTLNHTLLSLEALRARHLEPQALFLVGEPHPSNRATLARASGIRHVFELPPLAPLDTAALDEWLDRHDLSPVLA